MEEGAHGPEMAALNPARSKTGFTRHTKAPRRAAPHREMRETKKRMREREREREREHFHQQPSPRRSSLVGK